MPIKEKPLIDAVSRLGPAPGFLYANAVFAGFVTLLMCALAGGVAMFFQAAGRGMVDPVKLFDVARLGATWAIMFSAVVFIGVAVSGFFQRDEARFRLLFLLGGVLGAAALVIADVFASDLLRRWLAEVGPIV